MGKALLFSLIASVIGIGVLIYNFHEIHSTMQGSFNEQQLFRIITQFLAKGMLVLFLLPFLLRLYRKWTEGVLTENEKLPGMDGIRAWLSPGNLICCFMISFCAWLGFNYSFWGAIMLTLGSCALYPILNSWGEPLSAPVAEKEDLSREREKVLQLLEAGKINAEESAELLNALGVAAGFQTVSTPPFSPNRKLVGLGGMLVLIGFFLPWMSINPDSYYASGSDIAHGWGWMILFAALGSAVIPMAFPVWDKNTQRKITLLGLGLGSIFLLWILTQYFRNAEVGLFAVLAGYILEWVGIAKEKREA